MNLTFRVQEILDWYEGETPGAKANLARMLMAGKLGGTGRIVHFASRSRVEHGPAHSPY
ncbi:MULTISPECIES: hypothetical protein [unclassified Methylocystis]|jgi:class I fructose-bisphosphate aldolase|uniref:hypothetical protein n=1 Tax=Methylocystis TaxID=133 RepID=UPI001AEF0261|nr:MULTISPECIES: hypothetical protein [unclassified Methylocystis]